MNILILHGPNLGILGRREPEIYGTSTLAELNDILYRTADEHDVVLQIFQSNYEGRLIDFLEKHHETSDAVIINPGGLAHTSVALMDALTAFGRPAIEVHITDPSQREDFRKVNYICMATEESFVGNGVGSYIQAIEYLVSKYG